MTLSPAERSYIYDSLVAKKVGRADSRKPEQFRPLKATCSFLPNSNGSSRIFTADGLECLTSVKAKVLRTNEISDLIKVDVDIQGQRDDADLCLTISSILTQSLVANLNLDRLRLTDKYSFQLFIDIVVLSLPQNFQSSAYTLYSLLSLTSMGTYLALKSTKLPLITSTTEDEDVEEEPTFSDDWESCINLLDESDSPVLLFVLAAARDNVIVDPSLQEQEVAEHGICIGYAGKIVSPVQSVALTTVGGRGIDPKVISKAIKMVQTVAGPVTTALNAIASEAPEYDSAF